MKKIATLAGTLFFLFYSFISFSEESILKIEKVLKLDLNASVNPATLDYFASGFRRAENEEFDLIAIRVNTPGGLVSVTKDILTLIGSSKVPVLMWVGPEGASATSAGAIIASGAHLLFMAEGSNIGAAAPVSLGKDIDEPSTPGLPNDSKNSPTEELKRKQSQASSDMKKKAVNDLVALVTSLSESRGRNSKAYKLMITEAASFTAKEALKEKVIDGIAYDVKTAVEQSTGKTLRIQDKTYKIEPVNPHYIEHEMGLGQKLFNILANPSLAYILFLIGAALIYFELQAPGGLIAGGLGIISLILAGLSFQVLPLNFGSLALIILAFIFFIIEIYITSFGLLSLAGIISLVIGSLFLFQSQSGSAHLPLSLIISISAAIGCFVLLIGIFWARELRKNKTSKVGNTLVGEKVKIMEVLSQSSEENTYQIKVWGEFWNATSPELFKVGDFGFVTDHSPETLSLKISKVKRSI